MGRHIKAPAQPQRIISLVPSQTELLFDLGVGARLVGRTHFCIHPAEGVRHVAKVGGTKRFRFDAVRALAPDLIIGNKEENYPEGIRRLARDYPVWMSDIHTLEDALGMIRAVGGLVDARPAADNLAEAIGQRFSGLPALPHALSVAYLIWRKPWMAAGAPTFIDHLLDRCGLRNVFAGDDDRYPAFELEALARRNPDRILLSSEPFPFKARHADELREACPGIPVEYVDGELFSWYGSRLLRTAPYFASLLGRWQRRR